MATINPQPSSNLIIADTRNKAKVTLIENIIKAVRPNISYITLFDTSKNYNDECANTPYIQHFTINDALLSTSVSQPALIVIDNVDYDKPMCSFKNLHAIVSDKQKKTGLVLAVGALVVPESLTPTFDTIYIFKSARITSPSIYQTYCKTAFSSQSEFDQVYGALSPSQAIVIEKGAYKGLLN